MDYFGSLMLLQKKLECFATDNPLDIGLMILSKSRSINVRCFLRQALALLTNMRPNILISNPLAYFAEVTNCEGKSCILLRT